MHDDGGAEPDEGADGLLGLDAADQGDAALRPLLKAAQDVRFPEHLYI